MDINISVVPATQGQFPALIELGRTFYSADHHALTSAYLNWLYLENPAGPAQLVKAEEDGLLIGLIALIPVMLRCGNLHLRSCFAVNVLTHPLHRNKNLFVKMIRAVKEQLSSQGIWLLGHPNKSAVPGWKRQKMEFRDPLHSHLARPYRFFRSFEVKVACSGDLDNIESSFWDAATAGNSAHIAYSPEFIRWRYISAPHRKYSVAVVKRKSELLGLRVTRRFKGPVDLLVDFVSPPGNVGDVLSSVLLPTLVMHSGTGSGAIGINKGCWRLPTDRLMPFFVTRWGDTSGDGDDFSMITLGASDF